MLMKKPLDSDVVTMAKIRIKNVFDSGCKVRLSFSGGKDSIVLADIVLKLVLKGDIDPRQLTVTFVDEEAMYDEVIAIVEQWRRKFMEAGVKFEWFCIPVRHYNCLNTLNEEENFICWDPSKKDVWVRPMPKFAIKDHPLLMPEVDNYQAFFTRLNQYDGHIDMIGVRAAESVQRLKYMSKMKDSFAGINCYPIYDMTDPDIWLYIYKNNLEIPKVYENLYRIGTPKNKLRISQFFSIDTAKCLVRMGEMYPDLMERVSRREPNAYLCLMYWDTEMFGKTTARRRQLEALDEIDYKEKVFDLILHPEQLETANKKKLAAQAKKLIVRDSEVLQNGDYKMIYNCIIAGDPKQRAWRAIITRVAKRHAEYYGERDSIGVMKKEK